jgi:hypothetical protein
MRRIHPNFNCFSALCAFTLALFALGACTPRRAPPATVSDLMEDRVTLDGLLMKCNNDPRKNRTDPDCNTARIAVERLAVQNETDDSAKRQAEFERQRELLRQAQEKQREQQESATKVDAYHLPLVPVEPPPTPAPTPSPGASGTGPAARQAGGAPAMLGQTNR